MLECVDGLQVAQVRCFCFLCTKYLSGSGCPDEGTRYTMIWVWGLTAVFFWSGASIKQAHKFGSGFSQRVY